MAAPMPADRAEPAGGDPYERDVYDLSAVRLPPPLVAALLPWWMSLGPAAIALISGRLALAALLTGGGMLLSVAAAAAILIADARHQA